MKSTDTDFKNSAPLGYLIHEVARLLKRRFEEEAKAHGITLPQWRALAQIALKDNITQRSLADAIDADQMTVSGILDRLEKRGLIDRFPDPKDSRAKLARLIPTATCCSERPVKSGSPCMKPPPSVSPRPNGR